MVLHWSSTLTEISIFGGAPPVLLDILVGGGSGTISKLLLETLVCSPSPSYGGRMSKITP